jgi:hypothetical protein
MFYALCVPFTTAERSFTPECPASPGPSFVHCPIQLGAKQNDGKHTRFKDA